MQPECTLSSRLLTQVYSELRWWKPFHEEPSAMAANDPLLQPYKLKHLTLRNRIMTTSHEPAYSEDGLPKERYRAYHVARAKGGIALTMTAGSASVSRDSPPVFSNVLAY